MIKDADLWYEYEKHVVQQQEGIDDWISEYVGTDNWCEWWPLTSSFRTTRTFSFKDPKHATMFLLKWT